MTRNALEHSGRVVFRSVVAVVVALRGPEACGLFKQDAGLVLAEGLAASRRGSGLTARATGSARIPAGWVRVVPSVADDLHVNVRTHSSITLRGDRHR